MGKSKFYVATRSATRTVRGDVNTAIEEFMSSGRGEYEGDMIVGVHVMNYCLERGIVVELTHLGDRAILRRLRAP